VYLELKIGSLESEKINIGSLELEKLIIGSLESEKIGFLESEKSGHYVHTGYLTFSLKNPIYSNR